MTPCQVSEIGPAWHHVLPPSPGACTSSTGRLAMCGIFCALSRQAYIAPNASTTQLLANRGPDSTGRHQTPVETRSSSRVHATFVATVLALRGAALVAQPLIDASTGSVLCWNGEAWRVAGLRVAGNDAELVFAKLVEACAAPAADADAEAAVVCLISSIQGPYALVFYDALHQRLYFGRDCLGRRSLLRRTSPDGALTLSSVCDPALDGTWSEVEADGVYVVHLHLVNDAQLAVEARHVPHHRSDQSHAHPLSVVGKSTDMRTTLIGPDTALPHDEQAHAHPSARLVDRDGGSAEKRAAKVTGTARAACSGCHSLRLEPAPMQLAGRHTLLWRS